MGSSASNLADRDQSSEPPIRLMIVDDSVVARSVLERMVSSQPGFKVVALAGNAKDALAALVHIQVDIVLLDIEMPGINGLEALPEILRAGRGARVVIVSSICEDGADTAVRALALGAADTLPKPGTGSFGGRFSEVLAERLRRIGRAPAIGGEDAGQSKDRSTSLTLRAMGLGRIGCLALGASTGGLHPLGEFLEALPPRIDAPILVTQHLPTVFMPFFARQIEAGCGRHTRVAEDGVDLVPDQILVAPGDAHLCIERVGGRIRTKLSRAPASSRCMPSLDNMFWSVSEIYGKSAVGIVFSGMGRDGLVGSAQMVDRGGAVLVQDAPTSAVWGMPRAVAEAGLSSAILPPAQLAHRVAAAVQGATWR